MDLDRRLLVIADIGVGPPHHGNRSRMRALLQACRELGYELHFAGVRLTPQERAATLPHVDRWVADFDRPLRRLKALRRVASTLLRCTKALLPKSIRRIYVLPSGVDSGFCSHWLPEARALQQRANYSRVLVAYVFNSAFLEAFPTATRKVLDTHDVFADRDARLAERGLSSEHGWISMTPASEIKGLLRADVLIGIQKHESEYFRSVVGSNCAVHTVGYTPDPACLPFPAGVEPVVGFLAGANALNVAGFEDFAAHVWPVVLRRQPRLQLLIAGGICNAIGQLPANSTTMGTLHDASEFYRRCSVTINPTFAGTGLKIKTIEALAFGRACVTTPHAAAGLEEFQEHGLFVADSHEKFAASIVSLCQEPAFAERAGRSAFDAFTVWRQRSVEELRLALGGP
jgi:glycosyltransferase involved in cell wall biosynthesis